jgi:hypothetical protein
LKEIIFEKNLTTLGDACFRNCLSLETIAFDRLTRSVAFGTHCFESCAIRVVLIPRHVEFLPEFCFAKTTSLRACTFLQPSSITELRAACFESSALPTIEIPSSVNTLGPNCFRDCRDLASIKFRSKSLLATIGDRCFVDSGLASIALPPKVASIGEESFFHCVCLKTCDTSKSEQLRRIEKACFESSGITSFTIPKTVEFIGRGAFAECSSLETILFQPISCLKVFTTELFRQSVIREICIPRRVEVIEERCFEGCRELSTLSFDAESALRRIENRAFADTSLKCSPLPRGVEYVGLNVFGLKSDPLPRSLLEPDPAWVSVILYVVGDLKIHHSIRTTLLSELCDATKNDIVVHDDCMETVLSISEHLIILKIVTLPLPSFSLAVTSGSHLDFHGVLVVFDTTNRQLFRKFERAVTPIVEFAQRTRAVWCLVGQPSREPKAGDVTESEGHCFAGTCGFTLYTEVGHPESPSLFGLVMIAAGAAVKDGPHGNPDH